MTFVFGTLGGSVISEKYGRRWTVFIMSLWAVMSATVCITSKTSGQILAGRCLNYVYAVSQLDVNISLTPVHLRLGPA